MKRFFIFIIILIITYLCGCFYEATFNINIWGKDTRASVVVIGNIIGLIIVSYPHIEELFK